MSICQKVAPFAGAWIEITVMRTKPTRSRVAPFAGAWIEMGEKESKVDKLWSLPSRERGLKWYVWLGRLRRLGRSLRGSVD